jgi:hypothetical protein
MIILAFSIHPFAAVHSTAETRNLVVVFKVKFVVVGQLKEIFSLLVKGLSKKISENLTL